MQSNKLKNLLEANKDNYKPLAAEKDLVHYKAERIEYNRATGERLSHPELIKTNVKFFPQVKKDLEKQGYAVEILYHPNGEYNVPVNVPEGSNGVSREDYNSVVEDAQKALAAKENEILALREKLAQKKADEATTLLAEKDAEIERLKAALAEKSEPKAETETKTDPIDLDIEDGGESGEEKAPEAPKGKRGPKKSEK